MSKTKMADHKPRKGEHGHTAAITALSGLAGMSMWRALRQDRKVKDMSFHLQHLQEKLADKDVRLRSASQAHQAAAAQLQDHVPAQELDRRVERAVHARLAGIQADQARLNTTLYQAQEEARAEKELRQQAQRAHLDAAGGQQARIQTLQQELGRATAKAKAVSTLETQLTAARSQMEKVLEDLQVERGLRVKAEADAKNARGVARDQVATMESLQEESEVNKAVAKKVSLLADQLAATKGQLKDAFHNVEAWKTKNEALVDSKEQVVADKDRLSRSLHKSTHSLKEAEESIKAFKGEVAVKEQQVKEAAQAGKVALLEGQVASNSKTIQKLSAGRADLLRQVSAVKKQAEEQEEKTKKKVEALQAAKRDLQDEVYLLRASKASSPTIATPSAQGAKKSKKQGKGVEEGTRGTEKGKDEGGKSDKAVASMREGQKQEGHSCGEASGGGSGGQVVMDQEGNDGNNIANEDEFIIPKYERRRLTRELSRDGWII